ncbi:hypothetical protein BH11PSE11_BH11PSE11_07560 [soil metagenome]
MHRIHAKLPPDHQRLLQICPLPGNAPFVILGARDRGCQPGGDYLFQGFRYVQIVPRDILIREDVNSWLAAQQ